MLGRVGESGVTSKASIDGENVRAAEMLDHCQAVSVGLKVSSSVMVLLMHSRDVTADTYSARTGSFIAALFIITHAGKTNKIPIKKRISNSIFIYLHIICHK